MAEDERVRITKTVVNAVKKPAKGELRIWDKEIKGLCLRVYASGRKVYALKYRIGGTQRWYTLGEHGSPLTPEKARDDAMDILYGATKGRDAQMQKLDRRKDLTVTQLIDLYLEEGPKSRPDKRASSWAADRGCLRNHVQPLLGSKIARSVLKADIGRMLTSVRAGKTAKDVKTKKRGRAIVRGGEGISGRVKASASAMFSWARDAGLVDVNPVMGVRLPQRPGKERFLSAAETGNLLETLTRMEDSARLDKAHGDCIRLLLMTGARKGEIVGLRWTEVDWARQRLVLPPERTKAGGKTGDRIIFLPPPAVAILEARKSSKSYVFPAGRGDGASTGLQKSWESVRAAAGIPDVRLHDLRHTFASFALASGEGLAMIGKALGHSSVRVTERYAHLSHNPVQALADRVGALISGQGAAPDQATGQPPEADLIPFPQSA